MTSANIKKLIPAIKIYEIVLRLNALMIFLSATIPNNILAGMLTMPEIAIERRIEIEVVATSCLFAPLTDDAQYDRIFFNLQFLSVYRYVDVGHKKPGKHEKICQCDQKKLSVLAQELEICHFLDYVDGNFQTALHAVRFLGNRDITACELFDIALVGLELGEVVDAARVRDVLVVHGT